MKFEFPVAKKIVIKFWVAEIIDLSLSGVPLQGWGRIKKMKFWDRFMLPLVHVGDQISVEKE